MAAQARFKKTTTLLGILGNKGKGTAVADGHGLTLRFDDGRETAFRWDGVKRASFNWRNGLWAMRLKDGQKHVLQTTGRLFSIGDRAEGMALNDAILAGLAAQGIRVLGV